MRKKIIVLLAAASLGLGTAAPVAFAGTNGGTAEGDGTDYGWIGLLGLAGLAGLLGRKRDDRRDDVGARH